MIDVDVLIPFLVKHKLTVVEFMALHIKYSKKNRYLKMYKKAFGQGKKGFLSLDSKQKLVDLGYLVKDDTREGNFYLLGERFLNFYVDDMVAGDELWDMYPAFIKIKKTNAPLKSTDKVSLRKTYFRIINGLRHEHEEIILDTKYGLENGYIKGKITDYVKGVMWKDIRKIRLEDSENVIVEHNLNEHDF